MTRRPLKIAYLCDLSPLDPNLYSGGNARIYNALCAHAGEVTILTPTWHWAEPVRQLIHRLPDALNLRIRWRAHLVLRRIIARGVQRQLAKGEFDVLFCAYSFQSLAGVQVPKGMVSAFTSDATPTSYKNSRVGQSFGSFLSASRYFDPWVQAQEHAMLDQTDLRLWPTDWLEGGVQRIHGELHGETHIVPWGANIDEAPQDIAGRPLPRGGPVELLFIGRDWIAKGGPMACDVARELRARGVDARLTVIGVEPPEDQRCEAMQVVPSLDKSDPEQMAQFARLFRNAHFLINPSFESYGFAFCEAAAYGLPALCYRVGGVPVRDGVNGHALPAGAEPEAFADVIAQYLTDPDAYAALRISARREFETRLNWDAWGERVAEILRDAVDRKSGGAAREFGDQ